MLPAMRELTDDERRFALAICEGKSPTEAARELGRAAPSQSGYDMLRHPRIVAALREETTRALVVESAPLALRVLNSVLKDEKAPPNARVAAAKTILDRAGYVAPAKSDKPGEKPLAEQDTQDLRVTIERLESELAGRAKDVTPSQAADWDG
jgi:phage terminase small subunit